MDSAVRALGQRFLDGLLHALGAHGKRDHFAAMFFLQAQSFFERVTIRLVHLESDIGFLDPVSGDGERRVFGGNLLDTHDNFHDIFLSPKTYCMPACSGLFSAPALENQRGVGAAKSKRVRERVIQVALRATLGT